MAMRSAAAGGASSASANDLMPMVYDQLRDLAAGYLRWDAAEPMLEPAVLVNEAYLRMASHPAGSWKNKEHFLACVQQFVSSNHAGQAATCNNYFGVIFIDSQAIDT